MYTETCTDLGSTTECVYEGFMLSTDPVLVALAAAALVIYSAQYVRRVFYS